MYRVIKESLAAFEMFRRLGFESDDIYMALYANGIFMTLKTQGKEFTISCGPYPKEVDGRRIEELWKDTAVKFIHYTRKEKEEFANWHKKKRKYYHKKCGSHDRWMKEAVVSRLESDLIKTKIPTMMKRGVEDS